MRVVLSWSSGKDSAWALRALRADPEVERDGFWFADVLPADALEPEEETP